MSESQNGHGDTPMTGKEGEQQFKVGDRVFSHYVYAWGTVVQVLHTTTGDVHGVTKQPLPDSTWYMVQFDNGKYEDLDDAHGDWDMARIVPPHIAKRYGYGDDPKVTA